MFAVLVSAYTYTAQFYFVLYVLKCTAICIHLYRQTLTKTTCTCAPVSAIYSFFLPPFITICWIISSCCCTLTLYHMRLAKEARRAMFRSEECVCACRTNSTEPRKL